MLSLGVNIGLLFYFKYLIFFAENAIGLANLLGFSLDPIALKIILPLGISFYTFQTISYTVDVYRGHAKPQQDFVLYSCYVTFFPQLVAGPILRAREVIDQLADKQKFIVSDLLVGSKRIVYGLFLKVVLADNIAPMVDSGFSTTIADLSAWDVWTLAFLFGLQIYFDFSAYSHIAIGSARLMGIKFPENFAFPYISSSPKEFWKRWHISLGSWIRDYLYLPLSGQKVNSSSLGGIEDKSTDRNRNSALFITWITMGLWHGANWTFMLWGLYHAFAVLLHRLISPFFVGLSEKFRITAGFVITLPLMMLAWIPFRADSVSITFEMWSLVLNPANYFSLGMRENVYLVTTIMIFAVTIQYFLVNSILPHIRGTKKVPLWTKRFCETLFFAVLVSLVLVFLRPVNQFIYFQF